MWELVNQVHKAIINARFALFLTPLSTLHVFWIKYEPPHAKDNNKHMQKDWKINLPFSTILIAPPPSLILIYQNL
jgi:hypothetical protein